jgi:hypothetical protein
MAGRIGSVDVEAQLGERVAGLRGSINRLKACEAAGIEPQFVAYDGKDPLAFVISMNVPIARYSYGRPRRRSCKPAAVFPTRPCRYIVRV